MSFPPRQKIPSMVKIDALQRGARREKKKEEEEGGKKRDMERHTEKNKEQVSSETK